YAALAAAKRPKLLLATYFGALDDNLPLAAALPADGLRVDLVRGLGQLDDVLKALPDGHVLSAALIDGRNIWRSNPDHALVLARHARDRVGDERLWLAPSCSLLHVPVDLVHEPSLDAELRTWLSFARQKVGELRLLADALAGRPEAEAG